MVVKAQGIMAHRKQKSSHRGRQETEQLTSLQIGYRIKRNTGRGQGKISPPKTYPPPMTYFLQLVLASFLQVPIMPSCYESIKGLLH
jgi:hypothetical protein